MPISAYSPTRDLNASIPPGNIIAKEFATQQIVNSIRQLMADLAGIGSGQVQFPAVQNPSADPNTLDDYEEGLWTPTLITTGVALGSVTYDASRYGHYTKTGRHVIAVGHIMTSAVTVAPGTGGLAIGGFPFDAGAGAAATLGYMAGFVTAAPTGGVIFTGAMHLYKQDTGINNSTIVPVANAGTGAGGNEIYFAASYNV